MTKQRIGVRGKRKKGATYGEEGLLRSEGVDVLVELLARVPAYDAIGEGL